MRFPDYAGNGTVNLIASVQVYCGIEPVYPEARLLPAESLGRHENLVVFLVDALWYEWIRMYAADSFLGKSVLGYATSVFPSTTATAVTTFNTGLTASEHAIMAWNMYTKESASIMQILPWKHRILSIGLGEKLSMERIAPAPDFFGHSEKDVFVVTSNAFKDSKYNRFYNKNAKVLGYSDLSDCFERVHQAVTFNKKQKYVYAYWGDFDSISHAYGTDSVELKNHFDDIDAQFAKLFERLRGTNTGIVVTADHGQIDVPPERKLDLGKLYPELVEMLAMPLAWEPRCQYCFVKNEKRVEFRSYVEKEMTDICAIFSEKEARERKLFGHGDETRFRERIGDFVLIPKENYALFHDPLWEITDSDRAMHWWLDPLEMHVPLIYFFTWPWDE